MPATIIPDVKIEELDKNELVEKFMPLAVSLAENFTDQGLPLEDLVQEAYLGLVEAANGDDPTRGFKFVTYARKCIRNALKRAVKKEQGVQEISVGHKADMDFIINNDLDRKPGRATSPEPTLEHVTHRVKHPDGTYSFNGKPEVPEILGGLVPPSSQDGSPEILNGVRVT